MNSHKRIGIWLRVSTDMQVLGDSPEHHEQRARYYCEAKEWVIVEIYRLDAVSGKSVMGHVETKRMLSDIRRGHITGLVFSKLARVARNTKELLEFADIFRTENADLISLSENIDTSSPAGRLFFTIISAMAEWERDEIASRVAASVPIRAKLGKPLGGQASYGYKWEGKELVVDEKESPVRKLLYELFLKHQRKKRTASELNALGYRTRNGAQFSDTTVGRLLRDTTAKGERRANYTKSTGDGKKWIVKPTADWIVTACPPIVSADVWDECNHILDTQERKNKRPGKTALYLLSGFINCSCGKSMYVYHSAKVYVCKGCKNRIAVEDIDEIYQHYLKGYLSDINPTKFLQQSGAELTEKKALLDVSMREHAKLSRQVKDLMELFMDGKLTKETFPPMINPVQEQIVQLEKQIPDLEAEISFREIQLASSDTVLGGAKALYEQWGTMPFETKRAIVETITDKIEIGKEDISITLSYLPTLSQKGGNSQHDFILALPISAYSRITLKSGFEAGYPAFPETLGQHIRKRRMDLRLFQKEVAELIGTSIDCITFWENGRALPQIHFFPKIISFLGYYPFEVKDTFSGRITKYRRMNGLTYKQVGTLIGVNGSTVASWESGKTVPNHTTVRYVYSCLSY